jgi:transcriptional regulator
MPRADNLQGALELLILKALRRGPSHGFAIATLIEQASEDVLRVEEGSLYPALHRLTEAGLLKAEWKITDAARRARVYSLTASGRRRLAETEARWHDVTAAVARVLRTI